MPLSFFFKEKTGRDVLDVLMAGIKMGTPVHKEIIQEFFEKSTLKMETKDLLLKINDSVAEDYDQYLDHIKKIEAQVLAGKLPDEEKAAILKTAAITRYSAYFWKIKTEQYPINLGSNARRVKGFLRWLVFVTADNLGGILGIFTGDIEAEAAYNSSQMIWYADAYL